MDSPVKVPKKILTTAPRKARSNRWALVAAILAVFCIAIAFGCWEYFSSDPLKGIAITNASRADIEVDVLATGTLRPVKLVAVGAQVSGRLTSMKVAVGQTVKKGDLVAEIDDVSQQNALKTANASLDNFRAQLLSAQSTFAYATSSLARSQITYAHETTTAEASEAAQTLVETTRYEIDQIKAEIASAEIAIDTANVNLGYTRILAPIDGMVLLVVTPEGQTVNASQTAPTIIILGQVDQMTVRAEISEADVMSARPGLPVYFTVLGNLVDRWDSKLASIDPAPDALRSDTTIVAGTTSSSTSSTSTTSLAVYYYASFDVPNPGGKLLTYMTAQVRIVLDSARQVLTVPSSAVSRPDAKGERSVEVVDAKSVITRRVVKTGLDDKARVQIISGLQDGERVVSNQASAKVTTTSSTRIRPPSGL